MLEICNTCQRVFHDNIRATGLDDESHAWYVPRANFLQNKPEGMEVSRDHVYQIDGRDTGNHKIVRPDGSLTPLKE